MIDPKDAEIARLTARLAYEKSRASTASARVVTLEIKLQEAATCEVALKKELHSALTRIGLLERREISLSNQVKNLLGLDRASVRPPMAIK